MCAGRDIVGERQIVGSKHGDDASRRTHFVEVHRGDFARRNLAGAKRQMQRICGRRDVVDIAGLACDVQGGCVMGQGFMRAHGWTSRTDVAWPDSSAK